MQLNEIIDNNGIAAISRRTRVSVLNIERLANRDFTDMQRVKAQGFISILEREYDADLEMLRQECRDYFATNTEEVFDVTRIVTTPMPIGTEDKPVSKVVLIVILALLGYASWYFFVDKEEQFDDNNTVQTQGFISKIIKQAGDIFSSSDSIEDINDTPAQSDEVWAKSDTEQNATETPVDSATDIKEIESNESIIEEKIIRDAKEEQKDIIISDGSQKPATDFEVVDYSGDGLLASEVPSMASANNADEAVAIEDESDNAPAQEPEVAQKPKPKPKKTISKVVFHPLKKIWVGYTNLKTMKRKTEITKDSIDFDTSKGDWIIAAAHGAMNFTIDDKEVKVERMTGNYFLIKSGKISPISKSEFQKLNKSTAW